MHYQNGNTENSVLWFQFRYHKGKEDLMPLKPCLNLCWHRWQKANLNLVNNFIPTESLILKVIFWAGLINFNNVLQNRLYKLKLWMSGSSWFHSLMTLGMKEFLEYSDLQEIILNELMVDKSFSLMIDGTKL